MATDPSTQQVTNRSPLGEYAILERGLLNWQNSSATEVLSISNTLITPDSKPHEKRGREGCAAIQRA
jgi:hypothetical protein